MQDNAFKTILEQLEATGDQLSGWNPAHSLNQFDALTASVFGQANSKKTGNGNLWTAAISAYADDEYIRESIPVFSQAERPSGLAQLREKLGHDLSIGELCSLRRKFAFEHHPDRLPPTERISATSKLAIANDLIDLAIQKIDHNSAPG